MEARKKKESEGVERRRRLREKIASQEKQNAPQNRRSRCLSAGARALFLPRILLVLRAEPRSDRPDVEIGDDTRSPRADPGRIRNRRREALSKTRRLFFFHRYLPQQNFKTLKTLSLSLKRTELVGTRGIEPLRTIIEQRRVPGDLLESFSGTPTLIWLLDALGVEAGAAADCLSLLGALLAGAAFAGYLGGCAPLFVALSLLYLALIAPLASATTRGSSLPWAELPSDGLLLEAAFAAALWAPLWPKSKEEKDEEDDEREEVGGGNEEAATGPVGSETRR